MTRLLIALALCLPLAAKAADGVLGAIQKSGTIRLGHLQSARRFPSSMALASRKAIPWNCASALPTASGRS